MNILAIHNDNLPDFSIRDENIQIKELKLEPPVADFDNYDEFVSDVLGKEFKQNKNNYDLIVLPYSLSSKNYMEFSGITVALHIRLTKDWNHTKKPILFVGPDKPEEVMKFSSLGNFLNTSFVFKTSKKEESDFMRMFEYIRDKIPNEMSNSQYEQFINRIHIEAPANYGRHALANEWCILRWSKILNMKCLEHFSRSLFFKYNIMKIGKPQTIKKDWVSAHQLAGKISGIEGRTIAYIDDEWEKWNDVLNKVISENSNANFEVCNVFDKSKEREDLISDIHKWIDRIDADCWLIDLRLHDSDFAKNAEISGHKISEYIKTKNKGNQIVIFTASNKIWNQKKELLEINKDINIPLAKGYALKESPVMNLLKDESLNLFNQFTMQVKEAVEMSYLKELVNIQRDLVKKTDLVKGVDSYIDLLLFDNNRKQNDILKSCLLIQIVFLETYLKDRFVVSCDEKTKETTHIWNKYMKECKGIFINKTIWVKTEKNAGHSNIIDIDINSGPLSAKPGFELLKGDNDFALIIAACKMFYNFSEDVLRLIVRFKNERNTKVAHNGGPTEITIEDLVNFHKNVIAPIINYDFPD